jgi:hypothetical protein
MPTAQTLYSPAVLAARFVGWDKVPPRSPLNSTPKVGLCPSLRLCFLVARFRLA